MSRIGVAGRGVTALVSLGLLGGCVSQMQETFGFGKRSPDEFQVVRGAPLTMPPDYSLRPPRPGEPASGTQNPSDSARATLLGPTVAAAQSSRQESPGERSLLAQATPAADPDIRRKLADENTQMVSLDQSTFLFILNFQRRNASTQEQGTPLDPVAEARRLRGEGVVSTVRIGEGS